MQASDQIETATRLAKECHTKAHWEDFFDHFGLLLSQGTSAKLVADVFKRLEADPQSLYYNPKLWGALIKGAIASWNTETGISIAAFSRKLTTPVVSIPASQVLLDGGKPSLSREFAQRALRLEGLSDLERVQLELIVASSFAEDGKIDHAVRVLAKVTPLVRSADMSQRERADFVVRMGRLQYFMGKYPAAAKSFEEAAPLMIDLKDWEGAAKALFNSGACIQNSGVDHTESATALVERCRNLSIEHNLWGPLSHCEAFYGVESFNKGQFIAAREHFRRAMTVIPTNDKTFRRLHIMSFLSMTYFALGRFSLGIKFGRQTLDLAALDTSDRFKTRYKALEAEILWEEGKIPESMEVLKAAAHQLSLTGVRRLEELSTLTRYQVQLAILGESTQEHYKIDESLQKNQTTWLPYQYSCSLLRSSLGGLEYPLDELKACIASAKSLGMIQYQALATLTAIRCHLQKLDLKQAQELLPALEAAVSRIGDSPIRAKLQFVYAAIAYQSGNFERAIKILHNVDKMAAVSWTDRFALQACLATIRGESPRFQNEWQQRLVARFVRGYFAPNIRFNANREVVVSGHYRVSLEKHPAMADLLLYLSERGAHGASLADIQTGVWKQSLNTQGWQQKIRNSVMRLRDLFPYTIAPILVHHETLRFFGEALRVVRDDSSQVPVAIQVRHALSEGPLSSQQIADRISVSLATAKRLLRKMTDHNLIEAEKQGRNVLYHIGPEPGGQHPHSLH
jgi:tetratricopeptide (TPR) repeat protein/DNA-binding transcriptional ArsR family regulator